MKKLLELYYKSNLYKEYNPTIKIIVSDYVNGFEIRFEYAHSEGIKYNLNHQITEEKMQDYHTEDIIYERIFEKTLNQFDEYFKKEKQKHGSKTRN